MTMLLAGCGSSVPAPTSEPPTANQLLGRAFEQSHQVHSGIAEFDVSLAVTGRRTSLSDGFSGPFEVGRRGQPLAFDFSVYFGAQANETVELVSTGHTGEAVISDVAYRLPTTVLRRVASAFGMLTTSVASIGRGVGAGGIPSWIEHPRIVGTAVVDRVTTTEIRAQINLKRLVGMGDGWLLGVSAVQLLGPGGGSSASKPVGGRTLIGGLRDPLITLWIGSPDQIVHRFRVRVLTGRPGRGRHPLRLTSTLTYSNVNLRQTIGAPAYPGPFSKFAAASGPFLPHLLPELLGYGTSR
jgi:hypothetical protein